MDFTPEEAMRLFLLDREDANLRPATLGYYRFAISRFIATANVPTVSALNQLHLREWTAAMRARELKPSAIRSQQGAVWTWLRWLHDQDEYGVGNITKKVKMVTVRDEDVTRRTVSALAKDKMLKVARARPEHPRRNAAIVEVLWSTGARRSELAQCVLADYDEVAGTLILRHTKTGKPRLIAVERSARNALTAYIIRERGNAAGPLFIGRGRTPLTGWGIAQVVGSLAEGANVKVAPHDFRRAAAARWLKMGAPLDVVMSQLGHDDASMTLTYGKEGREERAVGIIHELDAGVRPIWKKRSG